MADLNPEDTPIDLEKLVKDLPEGVDMDEFVQNVTRMAMEYYQDQGLKPVMIQLLIFFGCVMITLSLLLYCFCKLLSSHRKRQGKDKKKQKEQKKETKKETKKDTKKKV